VAATLARYADSSREEVRNDAGIVTGRDDSGWPLAVPAGILGKFSAGEGSRTPDLARMKRPL
jgi:hypothetical protein